MATLEWFHKVMYDKGCKVSLTCEPFGGLFCVLVVGPNPGQGKQNAWTGTAPRIADALEAVSAEMPPLHKFPNVAR